LKYFKRIFDLQLLTNSGECIVIAGIERVRLPEGCCSGESWTMSESLIRLYRVSEGRRRRNVYMKVSSVKLNPLVKNNDIS